MSAHVSKGKITAHDFVLPVLTEQPEGDRTWIVRWFCVVPPQGALFRVLREEWHDENGMPCRDIIEIELT
jgi:hypothetical protein